MTQFNSGQRGEAFALLEQMAWGDMDNYICTLETALGLALEATDDDFYRWEHELEPTMQSEGCEDEFSVTAARLEQLTSDEKLAYVARLLMTLALAYGVSEVRGGRLVGEATMPPAALLRGLNDITWMPTGLHR
jgi:hypothetical protein